MKTIKELLNEVKTKAYIEDYYGEEVFNETYFALSILFIWHMAYYLLNSQDIKKEESLIQKCNDIMDKMKRISTNYSNLSYTDLEDLFCSYWELHPIYMFDQEEDDDAIIKSQVLEMLKNTCTILEKKGCYFTSVLKKLTETTPEDKSGFIKTVASIITFEDGDASTKLPSLLCSLLNLKRSDRYLGIAPSSPFCIHTSFLLYHEEEMADAIIVASQTAPTYMYMNLLHCYSGTIVENGCYYADYDHLRDKAIYIAPAENTTVNDLTYTIDDLFCDIEDFYSFLEDDGIGIIVLPSSYFNEDGKADRIIESFSDTNCIDSIVCLPSHYKGDNTSTLLLIIRKERNDEDDKIQIIDIFNQEGNGQLYISTPYASFPYSITQEGKTFIKEALINKNCDDSRVKYISSLSLKTALKSLVKTESWANEGKESISNLLTRMENLVKEARDFLKQ